MKIETPYQCPKNIDHMPKTIMGKYCDLCNKEVFDFTKKPTAEIIDIIKANNGNVCGQIPVSRLSAFKNYTSTWKYLFISLISLKSLFFNKVLAQNIQQKEADNKAENKTITREIKGEVVADSNVVVRYPLIEIYRNQQLIEIKKGDLEGKFNVRINDSPLTADTISIKAYSPGLGTSVIEHFPLQKHVTNFKIQIKLKDNQMLDFEIKQVMFEMFSGKMVMPQERKR